jgi:hypothetical protein
MTFCRKIGKFHDKLKTGSGEGELEREQNILLLLLFSAFVAAAPLK